MPPFLSSAPAASIGAQLVYLELCLTFPLRPSKEKVSTKNTVFILLSKICLNGSGTSLAPDDHLSEISLITTKIASVEMKR